MVFVGFGVAEGYARSSYSQDLWAGVPSELVACDRDYLGGGHASTESLQRLRALEPGLQVVGSVRTLQGARRAWGVRSDPTDPTKPSGCGVGVWLQTGRDELRGYALSGGP